MASLGPTFVAAATSVSEAPWSGIGWTGTGSEYASDDTYTSITSSAYDTDVISYRKRLTMSTNAFAVPSDATINGVLVEVEHKWTAGTTAPYYTLMQLVQAAARLGTNKGSSALVLPAVEAFTSYGGADDLWGASLTPAIVNSSTFGVDFACTATANNTDLYIDSVRITVYYTAGGTKTQVNIGDVWKTASAMQINIGDTWKPITHAQINIGDSWKSIF